MKKVILIFVTLLLTFMVTGYKAEAIEGPVIRIDGELKSFSPPARIVNGRTMIPLRFVIEDGALRGAVAWNGSTRQVNVTCRNKNFVFTIGSKQVLINGQQFTLDVPPYIYQDRTYLPLRFIAENLDGTVSWSSSRAEVNIYFNQSIPMEVFAYYYWGGFQELKDNGHLFSDVALRWFETNANGDLFYEYEDNYAQVLDHLRQRGIRSHASVVFMDKDGLHTLLSNPRNRSNLISQLIKEVQKNNYDGVNIDFEFIPASDSEYFTIFLQELKDRLGGKELSVAVFARTSQDKWPTPYNYGKISKIVDRIVLMTYDYSYKTSSAGPIAPLWWIEDVVRYMIDEVGAEPGKLLLGMATYGYNWGVAGQPATTVTMPKLTDIKSRFKVGEYFDPASISPYFKYTDAIGIKHTIWLENERSLSPKIQTVRENHLAGISFWRIGNGFADLYDLLEEDQL